MDEVHKKYMAIKKMNPEKLIQEFGYDISKVEGEGDNLGMGVVRKAAELNADEKKFLLAVERGDIPTVRVLLGDSTTSLNINVNCVDPLGRTALIITIENENLELLQLLIAHNVELGDALLHAINEENVEAVLILLQYQSTKKDLSVSTTLHFYNC